MNFFVQQFKMRIFFASLFYTSINIDKTTRITQTSRKNLEKKN